VDTVHTLNSAMSHAPDDSAEKWPEPEFKQIFLQHHPRIVAVVLRLLGDPMRAEEVTNDAFMRLYQQPALGRAAANIPGWLYRTASNLGIDAQDAL
jgi:RNA polymerase sigma-70 factor (ECF subfamily)